jgi:hypothetical protein
MFSRPCSGGLSQGKIRLAALISNYREIIPWLNVPRVPLYKPLRLQGLANLADVPAAISIGSSDFSVGSRMV